MRITKETIERYFSQAKLSEAEVDLFLKALGPEFPGEDSLSMITKLQCELVSLLHPILSEAKIGERTSVLVPNSWVVIQKGIDPQFFLPDLMDAQSAADFSTWPEMGEGIITKLAQTHKGYRLTQNVKNLLTYYNLLQQPVAVSNFIRRGKDLMSIMARQMESEFLQQSWQMYQAWHVQAYRLQQQLLSASGSISLLNIHEMVSKLMGLYQAIIYPQMNIHPQVTEHCRTLAQQINAFCTQPGQLGFTPTIGAPAAIFSQNPVYSSLFVPAAPVLPAQQPLSAAVSAIAVPPAAPNVTPAASQSNTFSREFRWS